MGKGWHGDAAGHARAARKGRRRSVTKARASTKSGIQRSGAYYRAEKRTRRYNLGPMKHLSANSSYGRVNPYKRPRPKKKKRNRI